MKDDLIEGVIHAYLAAVQILDPVRFRVYGETGATVPQMRVLLLLRDHGRLRPSEIAHHLGVSASTVTGITDRLVRQELLIREEDSDDRRCLTIRLSYDGVRLTSEVSESTRMHLRSILTRLTNPQLITLSKALTDLVAASE